MATYTHTTLYGAPYRYMARVSELKGGAWCCEQAKDKPSGEKARASRSVSDEGGNPEGDATANHSVVL